MARNQVRTFCAMGLFALLMGCSGSPASDPTALPTTGDAATTTTALREMPTVLTSLPQEGEADTYPAPDLRGFSAEDVLEWAEASGLTQVNVFDSESEITTELVFNSQRLTLVVQHDVVTYARIG